MSELTEKAELTKFEIQKLQRMAAYLLKENEKLSATVRELNIKQFRRFNEEECWIWQGDGSDYLESLVCPVVISARDLQPLVKLRDELKLIPSEIEDSAPHPDDGFMCTELECAQWLRERLIPLV